MSEKESLNEEKASGQLKVDVEKENYEEEEEEEEEEEDMFDKMVTKSGCAEEHFALQDCHFEHKDWRKCTEEMQKFKVCMKKQEQRKKQSQ